MTLSEIKKQVAAKYGLGNWDIKFLVRYMYPPVLEDMIDEVANIYKNQIEKD